ncbi:MAG: Arc family DNA-binding protein [Nitrososphaerales archaeon]
MKKKYVPVRLPEEILERVKKVALAQGKSVSEEIGILVRNSLESDHGPDQVEAFKRAIRELRNEGKGEEDYRVILADLGLESLKTPSGSGSGIDLEQVKKEIGSVLENALKPIRETLMILRAEGAGGSTGKGSGIDPEVIRFLTEKVSLTSALLIGVSSKMAGTYVADHSDRMRQAKSVVVSEMKTLSKEA